MYTKTDDQMILNAVCVGRGVAGWIGVCMKRWQTWAYLLAIDFDIGDIILKDSRHIDLGKLVFAKDDQKASFTAGTIADNYQFLANRRHWRFWKWQSRCNDTDSGDDGRCVVLNIFAKIARAGWKISKWKSHTHAHTHTYTLTRSRTAVPQSLTHTHKHIWVIQFEWLSRLLLLLFLLLLTIYGKEEASANSRMRLFLTITRCWWCGVLLGHLCIYACMLANQNAMFGP